MLIQQPGYPKLATVTSYFDTSLIAKLYLREAESAQAMRIALRAGIVPVISSLCEIEMAAAVLTKVYRSPVPSRSQLAKAYAKFQEDTAAQRFRVVPVGRGAFALARTLAETHAGPLGLRALDILHVAIALSVGADAFGTFDGRQRALAQAVGLQLLG